MPSKKKSVTSKTKKKITKKLVTDTEVLERVQQRRKMTRRERQKLKKSIQEIKEIKKGPPKNIFKNDPDQRKAIQRSLKETQMRNEQQFDGDLKNLPEWMPTPLVYEFNYTKNELLKQGYTPEKILKFMAARRRGLQPGFKQLPHIPKEIIWPIDGLNSILGLLQIGKKSGIEGVLDAYLGKGPRIF